MVERSETRCQRSWIDSTDRRNWLTNIEPVSSFPGLAHGPLLAGRLPEYQCSNWRGGFIGWAVMSQRRFLEGGLMDKR